MSIDHNVAVRVVSDGEQKDPWPSRLKPLLGYQPERVTLSTLPRPGSATFRSIFLVTAPAARDSENVVRFVRRLHRDAGIIAFSHGNAGVKARLLDRGADAVFEFDAPAKLVAAAVNALTRRLLLDWSPADDVHLSPLNSTLRLGAEVFQLRKAEFRLCQYLVLNRGRWVSARELLRHVLEVTHDRETSVIRVHMLQIRKTLGSLSACITSKRGRGYRFFPLVDGKPELISGPALS